MKTQHLQDAGGLQMKDVSNERKNHFAGRNKILSGGQGKVCLAYEDWLHYERSLLIYTLQNEYEQDWLAS